MRRSFLAFFLLFFLSSCNVHTFTFGDGPKNGYKKVLKQDNFIGGLISNNNPDIQELSDEKNFQLVVKNSLADTLLSILSFGLYTPTTIIILK